MLICSKSHPKVLETRLSRLNPSGKIYARTGGKVSSVAVPVGQARPSNSWLAMQEQRSYASDVSECDDLASQKDMERSE